MQSKVFLSCGQRPEERNVAFAIGEMLSLRGFRAYVAVEAQDIFEVNSNIIIELKDSDYYLLVNFCRERIGDGYRGSLYANQEFAMACALGFDKILVINQKGIYAEGMPASFGVNPETFATLDDCLGVVGRTLERAKWSPTYSRRLISDGLRKSETWLAYGDLHGRFVYVDIHNRRNDVAALEATARLAKISGTDFQTTDVDRSPIKATGRPGFSHTIFPNSYETFDLFCVGMLSSEPYSGPGETTDEDPLACDARIPSHPSRPRWADVNVQSGRTHVVSTQSLDVGRSVQHVYLNSALDVEPKLPLKIRFGTWRLEYQVYAIGFPLLTVCVELVWPSSEHFSVSILNQGLS